MRQLVRGVVERIIAVDARGAAYDEGPPSLFVPELGTFIGSALDYCFCDGYPAVAAKAYVDVWERVNEAKAGGIAFTIIAGDVAVCP